MSNNKILEAYNEAKDVCIAYKQYKGDKRSKVYKRLQHAVIIVYMPRLNNFSQKLGLPNYTELFYNVSN